jgi:antitoxin HicB
MKKMSNIEELIKRPYGRVLTPDENGGYVADVLELPGCFSEGETADEAMENLEDAMRGWFEVALEQGRPIPEPLEASEFNGKILLRTPKAVHRECVKRALLDGVSLNQWLLEAIGERLGVEGFVDRLIARAGKVVPMAIVEHSVTSVTRMFVRGQEQVGTTEQLVEPNGEAYLQWTPIFAKETQNA